VRAERHGGVVAWSIVLEVLDLESDLSALALIRRLLEMAKQCAARQVGEQRLQHAWSA
jgi:hypothetical protein